MGVECGYKVIKNKTAYNIGFYFSPVGMPGHCKYVNFIQAL